MVNGSNVRQQRTCEPCRTDLVKRGKTIVVTKINYDNVKVNIGARSFHEQVSECSENLPHAKSQESDRPAINPDTSLLAPMLLYVRLHFSTSHE